MFNIFQVFFRKRAFSLSFVGGCWGEGYWNVTWWPQISIFEIEYFHFGESGRGWYLYISFHWFRARLTGAKNTIEPRRTPTLFWSWLHPCSRIRRLAANHLIRRLICMKIIIIIIIKFHLLSHWRLYLFYLVGFFQRKSVRILLCYRSCYYFRHSRHKQTSYIVSRSRSMSTFALMLCTLLIRQVVPNIYVSLQLSLWITSIFPEQSLPEFAWRGSCPPPVGPLWTSRPCKRLIKSRRFFSDTGLSLRGHSSML